MKKFNSNPVEMMSVQDMISAKEGWKSWQRTAKRILSKIHSIEETKANRWEIESLKASYVFFIDKMDMIIYLYSELINHAKDNDLERYVFDRVIKELQIIGKELRIESEKKSFKELNNKYIHGIKEAQVITSL